MNINSDNKQRIHDVLISDLQRRLFKQYNESIQFHEQNKLTDEDYDTTQSLLVNRVLHLDTLADVNDVLIEYGDLFPNEQVFTLEGTMNYIFKLLR